MSSSENRAFKSPTLLQKQAIKKRTSHPSRKPPFVKVIDHHMSNSPSSRLNQTTNPATSASLPIASGSSGTASQMSSSASATNGSSNGDSPGAFPFMPPTSVSPDGKLMYHPDRPKVLRAPRPAKTSGNTSPRGTSALSPPTSPNGKSESALGPTDASFSSSSPSSSASSIVPASYALTPSMSVEAARAQLQQLQEQLQVQLQQHQALLAAQAQVTAAATQALTPQYAAALAQAQMLADAMATSGGSAASSSFPSTHSSSLPASYPASPLSLPSNVHLANNFAVSASTPTPVHVAKRVKRKKDQAFTEISSSRVVSAPGVVSTSVASSSSSSSSSSSMTVGNAGAVPYSHVQGSGDSSGQDILSRTEQLLNGGAGGASSSSSSHEPRGSHFDYAQALTGAKKPAPKSSAQATAASPASTTGPQAKQPAASAVNTVPRPPSASSAAPTSPAAPYTTDSAQLQQWQHLLQQAQAGVPVHEILAQQQQLHRQQKDQQVMAQAQIEALAKAKANAEAYARASGQVPGPMKVGFVSTATGEVQKPQIPAPAGVSFAYPEGSASVPAGSQVVERSNKNAAGAHPHSNKLRSSDPSEYTRVPEHMVAAPYVDAQGRAHKVPASSSAHHPPLPSSSSSSSSSSVHAHSHHSHHHQHQHQHPHHHHAEDPAYMSMGNHLVPAGRSSAKYDKHHRGAASAYSLSNALSSLNINNNSLTAKQRAELEEKDREERKKLRDFWLSLSDKERRELVMLEKDAVLKKMKEQQKHTCSCSVCGRRRTVIEEELEMLYDAYYEELEQYSKEIGSATAAAFPAFPPLPYAPSSALAPAPLPPSAPGHNHHVPPPPASHRQASAPRAQASSPSYPPAFSHTAPSPAHSLSHPSHSSPHPSPQQLQATAAAAKNIPRPPPTQPVAAPKVAPAGGVVAKAAPPSSTSATSPAPQPSASQTQKVVSPGTAPAAHAQPPTPAGVQAPLPVKAASATTPSSSPSAPSPHHGVVPAPKHAYPAPVAVHAHSKRAHEEEDDDDSEYYEAEGEGALEEEDEDDDMEDEEEEGYSYEDAEDGDEGSGDEGSSLSDDEEEPGLRSSYDDEGSASASYEEDELTEAQRLEEGRRMFQIFAAKMFEQRVLQAYRERVALENQRKLLEEEEEREREEEKRKEMKSKKNKQKKARQKAMKQALEEQKLKKQQEKEREEEERREEAKRQQEEQRKKRDEEARKKQEEALKAEQERLAEEAARKEKEREKKKKKKEKQRLKAAEEAALEAAKEPSEVAPENPPPKNEETTNNNESGDEEEDLLGQLQQEMQKEELAAKKNKKKKKKKAKKASEPIVGEDELPPPPVLTAAEKAAKEKAERAEATASSTTVRAINPNAPSFVPASMLAAQQGGGFTPSPLLAGSAPANPAPPAGVPYSAPYMMGRGGVAYPMPPQGSHLMRVHPQQPAPYYPGYPPGAFPPPPPYVPGAGFPPPPAARYVPVRSGAQGVPPASLRTSGSSQAAFGGPSTEGGRSALKRSTGVPFSSNSSSSSPSSSAASASMSGSPVRGGSYEQTTYYPAPGETPLQEGVVLTTKARNVNSVRDSLASSSGSLAPVGSPGVVPSSSSSTAFGSVTPYLHADQQQIEEDTDDSDMEGLLNRLLPSGLEEAMGDGTPPADRRVAPSMPTPLSGSDVSGLSASDVKANPALYSPFLSSSAPSSFEGDELESTLPHAWTWTTGSEGHEEAEEEENEEQNAEAPKRSKDNPAPFLTGAPQLWNAWSPMLGPS